MSDQAAAALPIDWASTFELIFGVLIVLLSIAVLIWYFEYRRPRTEAFRTGTSRVAIWFHQGELIFWNPGQTFVFLKNKQLIEVGPVAGGIRKIWPGCGQEAVGPIQMQSALFNWEDSNVLTRDGQPLQINIGVWWKVVDAAKFVFQMYSDRRTDLIEGNSLGSLSASPMPAAMDGRPPFGRNAGSNRFNPTSMHQIADQWLRVITESTVRARINTLAVSEVVSAHAMQFLKLGPNGVSDLSSIINTFEVSIQEVLGEIQRKALDFGLEVERLEVQHVCLPKQMQDAIDETRAAFLVPIRAEQESEAQRIRLDKLVSVLGRDNVGFSEIAKNIRHANLTTPLPVFQPSMEKMPESSARETRTKLAESEATPSAAAR